ncbi:unnamed protein product [Orchesella dallaii]|uniref:CUB domain-containing protein n=1 Tax=Orchesella dallaii TaxID=48710 RepID=A0ABP1QMB7_9HEXA
MGFKITSILICVEVLLFCCTAVPLEFNTNENERISDPLSRSEGGFDDDFPEADQDSTIHYEFTTDEPKNNSLEYLITEIDEEVGQLFDENELLHHLMEEETNFLDIIAQKVASLHPNSSIERYDGECGGLLAPSNSGVIRYKENAEHKFHECTWNIEVPGATRIEFNLERNRFGSHRDFISITALHDLAADALKIGQKLRFSNNERSGFITGSRAMIRFVSKDPLSSKGFRLRFQKSLDFDTTIEPAGSECGGVIVEQAGYLNYKLGKDYLNNERCVWLLHSPGSERIHLQLMHDEFETCCDFISVNTIDPESGAVRNDTILFNARNWTQTIEAPLVVILFHSDDKKPGKGFSLKFRSSGNQLNVKYKYKLKHITGLFGTVEYPSEQAKWEGSVIGEQDIFVIASSWITIHDDYYTVIDWKAQPPNSSCLQILFSIYEPLRKNKADTHLPISWPKMERFSINRQSGCPDVITIPKKFNERFEKEYHVEVPTFIIVYKSMFDGHNNGTETRFKFDFSRKRYTCGGVLHPLQREYGIINYKESDYRGYQKNCSWTIGVLGAAGIKFTLENNNFSGRDHLSVASLDTVGPELRMTKRRTLKNSHKNIQAIVTGSQARVTFETSIPLIWETSWENPRETMKKAITYPTFRLRYQGLRILPIDVCGGFANPSEGDFGVIRYKEYWNYSNNDSCAWLIELKNASAIGIRLEKSGIAKCCYYNYITVSSSDDEWNASLTGDHFQLRLTGDTAFVRGQKAIVRFSPEGPNMGTGFRLSYKKFPDNWVTGRDDVKCGGVIVEQSGVLYYKPSSKYIENQQCVWLLHSPNSTSLTLDLFLNGIDYLDENYLEVSTIDAKTGSINKYTELFTENSPQTIEESMVVIVFKSLSYRRLGNEFVLVYSSNGTISDPEYKYNLCHLSDLSGKMEYSNSVWESTRSGIKEIFVLARSLNVKATDGSILETKLNWESGWFKKADNSCEYGKVTIYSGSGSRLYGWDIIERFPSHNVTSSCSDVVTVAAKELSLGQSDMFLAIYNPLVPRKNLLKEETTSFILNYQIDYCGGVYVGSSGVITYKFNDSYGDNKEYVCVWLIEVPLAESIFFELEGGKLKAGYDYITVSSIDPFIGVESREIEIR